MVQNLRVMLFNGIVVEMRNEVLFPPSSPEELHYPLERFSETKSQLTSWSRKALI
jgi:hypothetical protein